MGDNDSRMERTEERTEETTEFWQEATVQERSNGDNGGNGVLQQWGG
jgi:hypothetical protein